jgi:hypothetical protein
MIFWVGGAGSTRPAPGRLGSGRKLPLVSPPPFTLRQPGAEKSARAQRPQDLRIDWPRLPRGGGAAENLAFTVRTFAPTLASASRGLGAPKLPVDCSTPAAGWPSPRPRNDPPHLWKGRALPILAGGSNADRKGVPCVSRRSRLKTIFSGSMCNRREGIGGKAISTAYAL